MEKAISGIGQIGGPRMAMTLVAVVAATLVSACASDPAQRVRCHGPWIFLPPAAPSPAGRSPLGSRGDGGPDTGALPGSAVRSTAPQMPEALPSQAGRSTEAQVPHGD
jgi:hypothetical protein